MDMDEQLREVVKAEIALDESKLKEQALALIGLTDFKDAVLIEPPVTSSYFDLYVPGSLLQSLIGADLLRFARKGQGRGYISKFYVRLFKNGKPIKECNNERDIVKLKQELTSRINKHVLNE